MANDVVIRVENLGKRYQIGKARQRHDTLRDALMAGPSTWLRTCLRAPLDRLQRNTQHATRNTNDEHIWALKDVSFEVQRGEVVGIIGRNGAGKSTLLKILSRITEPTEGEARIHGRVGSLLEVGTGFHPELTGRENIYLNGAILGMKRVEIDRKFDEIVAFAEIEKFMDTPVKRYSSGMYVRLAFAVAAHLEPEILLVDEVLAVGDAAFQRKALGKMGNVVHEGRTVLFVSHNMAAVENLCRRVAYLSMGTLRYVGPTTDAIGHYSSDTMENSQGVSLPDRPDRTGSGRVRFSGFYVTDVCGQRVGVMQAGHDYHMVLEYENRSRTKLSNCVGSIGLTDGLGQYVMLLRSNLANANFSIATDSGRIVCRIRDLNLVEGTYGVTLFLSKGEGEILDCVSNAATVAVQGGDYFGTGAKGLATHCKQMTRSDWWTE